MLMALGQPCGAALHLCQGCARLIAAEVHLSEFACVWLPGTANHGNVKHSAASDGFLSAGSWYVR
jgi:hypothetical protein